MRLLIIQFSIAMLTLIMPEIWRDFFDFLRRSRVWRYIQIACVLWIIVVVCLAFPALVSWIPMGKNTLARVSVPPKSELSTIPTPSAVESPATKLPVTKLSPQQIMDKISAERPFQQDEVAAAFIGTPVDWELFFVSATRTTRLTYNDKILVAFSDAAFWRPLVLCELPAKGYDYLRIVEKNERFRIKGIIKQADSINITLENVSLERLSDDKAEAPKQP